MVYQDNNHNRILSVKYNQRWFFFSNMSTGCYISDVFVVTIYNAYKID